MDLFDFREITCPTCGVDDTRALGVRGGASHRARAGVACAIVTCRGCGLIYPNPFPFPHDLDALYSASDGYFDAHPDTAFDPLLSSVEALSPGRRMLDVGAGRGDLVEAALLRGWDAWGVESSSAFAREAERRCPGRVAHGLLGDATELGGEPYDAVVLAAVLEHLHEPKRVLAQIADVLKPGGILYVEVPNEGGLFYRAGNLWERARGTPGVVHLSPTFPPYHVFGFTPRSLEAMLRGAGFEPASWEFVAGVSQLPFQRSARGALEWLGSRAVHAASGVGSLGNTMVVLARRGVSAV